MKLIFRLSILALLISLTSAASAQTFKMEVGYYNPGLRSSRFETKDTSTTYLNGLRIGGTVEFKLRKNMTLLTGAMYDFVYSNKLQAYKNSTSVNYLTYGHTLELPLRVYYYIPFNKNLKAFVYGGPNLRLGLMAKRGIVSTLDSTTAKLTGISTKMENLYKESLLNRLNVQVGLGAGVQWKKYLIKSGYDYGLLNMNNANTKKLYEGGWYISLGYQF